MELYSRILTHFDCMIFISVIVTGINGVDNGAVVFCAVEETDVNNLAIDEDLSI